jgi:hypothetical protein
MVACGGKNPGSYETLSKEGSAESSAMEKAEAAWAERGDEAKLQEALTAYESILKADPTNRTVAARLTRGWYFWGDSFSDDKDTKLERWEKAIEWGKACIALNDDIRNRIANGEKERDAVTAAVKADVPCLYWTSSALGKWGKLSGLAKTIKHLPTVKAYMSKAEELDETYFHYGPSRYWGAYFSIVPSFAGRDFDVSAEHFAHSLQGAPNYLGTRTLRAEFWAVGSQDAQAFVDDLNYVINAEASAAADVQPENEKEIAKAKKLLTQLDQLFDKKALENLK